MIFTPTLRHCKDKRENVSQSYGRHFPFSIYFQYNQSDEADII